jgi:hypothetical protein
MSQPPIVPGPDEPTWQQQPYSPPPQPGPPYPPPQVIYHQQLPPPKGGDVVGKTALGTITVIAILIAMFCILPLVLCFGFGMIGMLTDPGTVPTR